MKRDEKFLRRIFFNGSVFFFFFLVEAQTRGISAALDTTATIVRSAVPRFIASRIGRLKSSSRFTAIYFPWRMMMLSSLIVTSSVGTERRTSTTRATRAVETGVSRFRNRRDCSRYVIVVSKTPSPPPWNEPCTLPCLPYPNVNVLFLFFFFFFFLDQKNLRPPPKEMLILGH